MKKTIILTCLLGGAVVSASAAEVIQSYPDDSVMKSLVLPTNEIEKTSFFAVTYEVSGLKTSDLPQTGQSESVFSFNMGTKMGMPFMYRVYYGCSMVGLPEKTWGLFQQGGALNDPVKTIAATTTSDWISSGTFVFQYEETNDGALITFSKLSDDGSGLDTLISGTLNTYNEAFENSSIYEATMKIAYPEEGGTLSNVKLWSGVVEASDLAEASETVPEPTTATLSLLALAGLAARRCRK